MEWKGTFTDSNGIEHEILLIQRSTLPRPIAALIDNRLVVLKLGTSAEYANPDFHIIVKPRFFTFSSSWKVICSGRPQTLHACPKRSTTPLDKVEIGAPNKLLNNPASVLRILKILGRPDALNKAFSGGAVNKLEIERGLKQAKEKAARAEALLPLGGVLTLLGIGYFMLPIIGYQFSILEKAPPIVAISLAATGIAILVIMCWKIIASTRV